MKSPSFTLSFVSDQWKKLKSRMREESKKHRNNPKLLLLEGFFLLGGFLFSRTHAFFGAYPLGIGWVCALPNGVYSALIGCVLGAFSMGKQGVIYAMITAIAVLLRLFLCGGEIRQKTQDTGVPPKEIFHESPMLRSACAVLSGFVGGGYEVLLSGLSLPALLYASTMMVGAGIAALLFSLLFETEFPADLFSAENRLPPPHSKNGVFFILGLCFFLFSFSCAVLPLSVFGISVSYIFAGFVTLYFAFRFGAVFATAAGFVCAVAGGSTAAVSFALAGATAGILFPFGLLYALLGGGASLILWSGYTEGMTGFLSVFPEYAIAAALGFPFWRKIDAGQIKDKNSLQDTARDMVGAMALSFQTQKSESTTKMAHAFGALVPLIRRLTDARSAPDEEEYKEAICEVLLHSCYRCSHRDVCGASGIQNLVNTLLAKALKQESPTLYDLSFCDKDDEEKSEMLFYISLRLSDVNAKYIKENDATLFSDFCASVSLMLSQSKEEEEKKLAVDLALSKKLEETFAESGLSGSAVRVIGEREKTLIAAGADATGKKMTSPALIKELEKEVGGPLGAPSYSRKNQMVLFACQAKPKYKVCAYSAKMSRSRKEVSGDSACCFAGEDGRYFLCLSDGMGSGDVAKKNSLFCADYVKEMMTEGCSLEPSLYLLNSLIRTGKEECSVSFDLCKIDLFSGQAEFYKSGAAPSFLKRKDKVYRVRSQTVPLGILPTLDTEKIQMETKAGDVIIMFSDGVGTAPEDAPWLSSFLAKEDCASLKDYAEAIVKEADKQNKTKDDITVVVGKILAA